MVIWTPNDDFAPRETKAGWRTITRKEYFFPDGSLREFLEETGYEAGRMEPLGTAHHDGFSIAPNSYFLAFDCKKVGEPTLDPNEWIVTKEMPIREFLESAKRGLVTDTAAVLMVYDRLQELAAR